MAEMAGHAACAVEALLCTGPWFLALGGVVAKLASAGAPCNTVVEALKFFMLQRGSSRRGRSCGGPIVLESWL